MSSLSTGSAILSNFGCNFGRGAAPDARSTHARSRGRAWAPAPGLLAAKTPATTLPVMSRTTPPPRTAWPHSVSPNLGQISRNDPVLPTSRTKTGASLVPQPDIDCDDGLPPHKRGPRCPPPNRFAVGRSPAQPGPAIRLARNYHPHIQCRGGWRLYRYGNLVSI